MRRSGSILAMLSLPLIAFSADPPSAPSVEGVPTGMKGKWVHVPIAIGKVKCRMNGVAVDRTNGDVYILPLKGELHYANVGMGVWKSSDKGATFVRMTDEVTGGCGAWGGMDIDPAGGKLAVYPMYNSGALTLDAGKTWRPLTRCSAPPDLHNGDWISVDWSDPEAKTIQAIRHEAEPAYVLSTDSGKSWAPLPGVKNGAIGVVDSRTILNCSNGAIRRSEDLGKTWTEVAKQSVNSQVMRKFKDVCYLLGSKGLVVSADKGKTWTVQGTPIPESARVGPFFGKNENHIVVLSTKATIFETTDGGKTWNAVTKLPVELDPRFTREAGMPFSYDPVGDVFYVTLPNTVYFCRYER
jgi:hypothetical protein